MRRVQWKWLLPVLQLILAVASHIYDPHLYRVMARRGPVGSVEQSGQTFPTPLGRMSQGLSFPALLFAYPLRDMTDPVYERNSPYTLIWIDPHDIGFFAGVALLWCWVGRGLDRRRKGDSIPASMGRFRLAGLALGVIFTALTAIYANQMVASKWTPERHIGAFGIAWAFVLAAYITWRMARMSGTAPAARRAAIAAISAEFLFAAAWVGGPLCVVQAAGEYLRPTIPKMMLPYRGCEATDEQPPTALVRTVESQAAQQHLSIQRIVTCKPRFGFRPTDSRFVGMTFPATRRGEWQPRAASRPTYQFRRYFTVIAADVVQDEVVIVAAAMAQSRWDYLRSSWDRFQPAWSWPYPDDGTR